MVNPLASRFWCGVLAAALVAVLPGAAAADEDEEGEEGEEDEDDDDDEDSGACETGLGPAEFAPTPLGGNLGAPRSAVPETRLGASLHWLMVGARSAAGDASGHGIGVLVEGHLALFDTIEVGVDVEAIQYVKLDFPDSAAPLFTDTSSTDFGFITPRVKVAFVSNEWLTVAAGVGGLLPTATGAQYENVLPLGFDPGVYASLQPLSFVSINASIPLAIMVSVPDAGDTTANFLLTPSIGAAVMPIDYIGAFADLQLQLWLDADEGADTFQLMNLIIGVRSNPFPMFMLEAGAIIPMAGDISDIADFGLGIRLAATPDLF